MVILFGLLALQTIPYQLTPDVQRPIITVSTSWPGAAPAEIEREILIPQEDVLSGIEGVTDMLSEGRSGRGEITLEFAIGTDMNRALLLVANRLSRVSGYPDEADEPVLDTASSEDRPIARFNLVRAVGNDRPIAVAPDARRCVTIPCRRTREGSQLACSRLSPLA
jgi:HAE1 family hydrophobic/amphiphilic exporter-1